GVSICTRNRIMTGLRFLLRVTLRRLDLAAETYHIREPQKIPLVMSADETKRLLAVASSLKARILLSLSYGCGLRAGEVIRLKVKHIDSAQKIIRVEQSKGRKDRNVILSPEMLDLLRQWWKARPLHCDAGVPTQERWLFPGGKLGKPMTSRQLSRLFHEAAARAFAAYLAPLRSSEWVVYSKRPFGGPKEVLRYLARYTHRVAISNRRLVSLGAPDRRNHAGGD